MTLRSKMPRRSTKRLYATTSIDPTSLSELYDEPSKTQQKKWMHQLQELGQAIADLSPHQRKSITLEENLHEAIKEYEKLTSREAKRRQIQFIGKIMRQLPQVTVNYLADQVDRCRGNSASSTAELHKLEQFRQQLLNDSTGHSLTAYLQHNPKANEFGQSIRVLIRNYQSAIAHNQSLQMKKSSRELFQLLKKIQNMASSSE